MHFVHFVQKEIHILRRKRPGVLTRIEERMRRIEAGGTDNAG